MNTCLKPGEICDCPECYGSPYPEVGRVRDVREVTALSSMSTEELRRRRIEMTVEDVRTGEVLL